MTLLKMATSKQDASPSIAVVRSETCFFCSLGNIDFFAENQKFDGLKIFQFYPLINFLSGNEILWGEIFIVNTFAIGRAF